MNDIGFVNYWESDDRSRCWSGTPYSLVKEFGKKTNIVDIDIEINKFNKLWLLLRKCFQRFFGIYDFNLAKIKLEEKSFRNLVNVIDRNCGAFITFDELFSKHINRTYIYQDLSISYLQYCKYINKDLIKYTPAKGVSDKYIDIRLKRELAFYKECAGIFTMSQYLCDFLKSNSSIPSRKIHYVGGGCNIDVSRINKFKKKSNKFLFVGKDFERKNGPLVVQSFIKLHEIVLDAELYIVGPEKLNMQLPSYIHFLGERSYEDLVDIYNECNYFVMPSKFEAYGIVFAEALIFGLPCIGKNCFAMPEFIKNGENGFLIENDDVNELVSAMFKLIKSDYIIKNVEEKRAQYIERYSWSSVVSRILGIVNK